MNQPRLHSEHGSRWHLLRGILGALLMVPALNQLRSAGQYLPSDAATLIRFFNSKHVADLRFVAGCVTWVAFFGLLIIVVLQIGNHDVCTSKGGLGACVLKVSSGSYKYFGTILGLYMLVLGWVYRTASARLGLVDLFAYEITTLCRIGIIVDVARYYIDIIKDVHSITTQSSTNVSMEQVPKAVRPQGDIPQRFSSGENYFPVFDGNSRDLRVLDAAVVTNVTSFYTYMKVVRDYLRRIGDLDSAPRTAPVIAELRHCWLNALYMLFLAYEVARKAISELIEYEPTHVESTITALLSEITAFGFLKDQFRKDELDIRCKRLNLRVSEYQKVGDMLYQSITTHPTGDEIEETEWRKAVELWDELVSRYHQAGLFLAPLP